MTLPRTVLTATIAVGLLATAAVARQTAPDQAPVFRGGTRTVPVYATVTDRIGRFVLDLHRDDFEVRDNGKVQPIGLFTTAVQPLSAVVLLDGSRSMVNAIQTVMTAADHFVVRLMPGDRARIGSFADDVRFTPAFTADRDVLARQVNDLFGLRMGLGTSLWDAVDQAAKSFGDGPGRRVIVVFTDGEDTASLTRQVDALADVRRADAIVYAVLLRGGNRPGENRRGRQSRPQDLVDLAIATGGGYYFVGSLLDDMNAIATQVDEELHSQVRARVRPDAARRPGPQAGRARQTAGPESARAAVVRGRCAHRDGPMTARAGAPLPGGRDRRPWC